MSISKNFKQYPGYLERLTKTEDPDLLKCIPII